MWVDWEPEIRTRKQKFKYGDLLKRSNWGQKKDWETLKWVEWYGKHGQIKNKSKQIP